MADFKFKDTTEKLIGAALKVHNTLGCGFQEVIYPRILKLGLKATQMNYAREFEKSPHKTGRRSPGTSHKLFRGVQS